MDIPRRKENREQSHTSEYNLCSHPWLTTKLNKAQAKNTIAGRQKKEEVLDTESHWRDRGFR